VVDTRRLTHTLLLTITLGGTANADGPTEQPPSPLVQQLIAAGQHHLAYGHTMKAAFALPKGEARLSQLNRAGQILWQGELWQQAADHYGAIDSPELSAAGTAYSLYQLGHWENAVRAGEQSPGAEAQLVVAAAQLQLEQPAAAYARLKAIPTGSTASADAQAIAETMQTWGVMPHRSPALAGILSAVIPGSGQTYAGAWPDGLAALVVNGGLIGAGWQLAQREQWFGLGLVGLFELGFYGGNIMSAVNNAERFNRQAWQHRADQALGTREPRLVPVGSSLRQAPPTP
jgi:hypothetical protein